MSIGNPFAGIGVVELGAGSAVAYAGKLFLDLGADVTRIETHGEEGAAGNDSAQAEANALGLYLNARKQNMVTDPSADAGRAMLRGLLGRSRVLLHGANDRRFAEWGWSPETLARDFPDLVVVAVTPFGLKGEARYWPADDLTLQAIGGISIGIGLPGRSPLKLPGDQSAFQAGLAAAIAGAGALFLRGGVAIDVAAADVWAAFYTGVEVALAHFGRHKKQRAGHRVSGQPYPRTIFRCQDGYFAIQCGESRHWQSFLRMIRREDLLAHPLFANRFKANDEKFGLSYPELQSMRPDLVMCSMSAVGQNGPLRGIRTYATVIASLAGLDSLVGYPGGRVLGSQSSYADPNASLHAAFGILAALWRRQQTGEGAYIDLSQWEAAVNVMGEQVADHGLHDRMPGPCGTLHEHKVPHGNYPAAGDDQWIAISIASDDQWRALKSALGGPEWMSLKTFATTRERRANRAELDERLARETGRYQAGALASALLAAGVPAAPLLDASGIAASAQFRDRELFEMVEHPVLGLLPVYRLPWRIDGAPVPITRRAPLLGEHNGYTLQSVLGYSSARIDGLAATGLFE